MTHRFVRKPLALAILAFCGAVTPVTASIVHVAVEDPECGGATPCYASIQAAIDASVSGVTILVHPGVYRENVLIHNKSLNLLAKAGPDDTVIDGSEIGPAVYVLSDGVDVQTRIQGFTIRRGGGSTSLITNGFGIVFYGFQKLTSLIEGNVITENNVAGGIGVFPVGTGADIVIDHNWIIDNQGQYGGIYVDYAQGPPYSIRIADNIIAFNRAAPSGGGIWLGGCCSFEVVNNTIYQNHASYGGGLTARATGLKVINNILFANEATEQGDDIYIVQSPDAVILSNIIGDGQYTGSDGNLAADPLLVSPANRDFHLQSGSPALDAGDDATVTLSSYDFENDPRVIDGDQAVGALVDIGADEFSTNLPPHADAGYDIVAECTSMLGTLVTLNGTSSWDPDSTPGTQDDIAHYEWYRNYGLPNESYLGEGSVLTVSLTTGEALVTLKVTDRAGAIGAALMSATVRDTTPPVVHCSADAEVECQFSGGAFVDLALVTASDTCNGTATVSNDRTHGPDASGVYPLGSTSIEFVAQDGRGNSATCTMEVTVADTQPPTITASAEPDILWPANHRMRHIHVEVAASDACSSPTVTLVSILNSEANHPTNPRNHQGEIQGADYGTADYDFLLRAERSRSGPGRTYTITYRAVDGSGNESTATTTVIVPLTIDIPTQGQKERARQVH